MSKTVMIVDDSASVRRVVGIALKGAGYTVMEGSDGRDALSKLTGQKVHLIISDVNMPNMDGLDMAQAIRDEFTNRVLHIIMLTTEDNPAMRTRGKQIGVTGWIVKPFRGDAVLGPLRKLCEISAAAGQA